MKPQSPRLEGLQQDLAAGRHTALEQFWQEVASLGTPIVEPSANDRDHVLLTFLWRAVDPVRNVVVIDGPAGMDPARSQMEQLPGTDVWFRTYQVRQDAIFTYGLGPDDSLIPMAEVTPDQWAERTANWRPDPLNQQPFPSADEVWASSVMLPGAATGNWARGREGIGRGALQRLTRHSEALGGERVVWVYTPPGYSTSAEPYPLLLLFDGQSYTSLIPAATVLDNLIAAGKIPPLVAVLVENAGEARLRELACHDPMTAFVAAELMPWVRESYNVTRNPARSVIGGLSLGGLAAAYTALERPDLFGGVLAQSGSFTWAPEGSAEAGWLIGRFVETERLPVRLCLQVGLMETGATPDPGGPSLLLINRHFRDVLKAKGYAVVYTEYNGSHDYLCWREMLASGITTLFGTDSL